MNYLRTCHICGQELVPSAHGPSTPPWQCLECHHAWWTSELSQEARQAFQPNRRDFGYKGTPQDSWVAGQRSQEMAEALHRGVSLRPDQLGLVHHDLLHSLLQRFPDMHADFANHIRAQVRG